MLGALLEDQVGKMRTRLQREIEFRKNRFKLRAGGQPKKVRTVDIC